MDVKEENLDELLEKAELEAAGDEVVSSGRNLSDSDNENEEKENPYLVEFSMEYDWLNDNFDRLLIKIGHRPQNKFTDFTYCKYVAMHVTNRPAEFFNMLGIRDMMIVIALINHFFMYGQGLVMTGQ